MINSALLQKIVDTENMEDRDQLLSDYIETFKDLDTEYYVINYYRHSSNRYRFNSIEDYIIEDYINKLPKLRRKINNIINSYLRNEEYEDTSFNTETFVFSYYHNWLDNCTLYNIVKSYVNRDIPQNIPQNIMNTKNIEIETDVAEKAIDILVDKYKHRKTKKVENMIGRFVVNTPKVSEYICEKIANSTPAIQSCLLLKTDLNENYTLKGIKALSKLSLQRKTNTKVNFNLLKKLGPKSRLDAIKQLMGMNNCYYKMKMRIRNFGNQYRYDEEYYSKKVPKCDPFDPVPSRNDVEQFLFPCSLKHNDEVKMILERYDEIYGGEENGKCF